VLSSVIASAAQLAMVARDTLAVVARQQDLVLVRRNKVPSPSEIAAWKMIWAQFGNS
jgi:hypothetical protein